jgi:hypothetical protein
MISSRRAVDLMNRLITLATTDSVYVISKSYVITMYLVGTDSNERAWQIFSSCHLSMTLDDHASILTIFLVHRTNFLGVATELDYIVIKLWEVSCSCEFWPRNVAQGM